MLGLCPVVFGRFATVCIKFESCPFKPGIPYGLVDFREDLVAVRGVVENFFYSLGSSLTVLNQCFV